MCSRTIERVRVIQQGDQLGECVLLHNMCSLTMWTGARGVRVRVANRRSAYVWRFFFFFSFPFSLGLTRETPCSPSP